MVELACYTVRTPRRAEHRSLTLGDKLGWGTQFYRAAGVEKSAGLREMLTP